MWAGMPMDINLGVHHYIPDDEGVRSIAETAVTTSDLTQLILQRSEEAKEMQAKLIRCQEKIMKIYADNLSSSISNQCNIQWNWCIDGDVFLYLSV